MKKEICSQIIDCVSNITDVKKEEIFSDKKCVDIIDLSHLRNSLYKGSENTVTGNFHCE